MELMTKVNVIWGKILVMKDQFYLKRFPCGQIHFQSQQ